MILMRARLFALAVCLAEVILVIVSAVLIFAALFPWRNPIWLSVSLPVGLTWLIIRLYRTMSDKALAWALERANPQMGEYLVSWVELRGRVSDELLERLSERITSARPSAARAFKIKRRVLSVFLVSANLFCLRLGLSPQDFMGKEGSVGFLLPERTTFFSDQGTRLSVIGRTEGARVILSGQETKEFPAQPKLETGRLSAGSYKAFLVRGKDTLSEKTLISVERPYLRGIKVLLREPAIMGGREAEMNNPVSITGHQGGTVRIYLDHTGDSALLVWNGRALSDPILELEEDGILEICLRKGPLWTKSPRRLEISVIPDNPPTVRIAQPQGDVYLPDDERVMVLAQAEDDIGLRSLSVNWEFRGKRGSGDIPLKPGVSDAAGQTVASFRGMEMSPGDEALIWAEATDIRGQKSVSASIRVRFPSMEEIFGLSADAAAGASERAGDLKSQAEALSKKMQEIEDILKSSRDLSWEERERIARALSEAQELAERVAMSAEETRAQFQELSQLPSYDPELLEKFFEVQKLMAEVMNEELMRAIEELQRAIEKMDKKAVEEAMKNLKLNQEELKKRLERTEELLKRYAQEMRLQELAAEAERLAAEQEALQKEAEAKGPSAELARKQQELAEQIGNLKERAMDLGKELEESGEDEGKALEELSEQELSEALEESQEAAAQLSSGNKTKATKSQEASAQALRRAASSLGSMSCSLTGRRKEELLRAISGLRQEVIFTAAQVPDMHDIKDPKELKARARVFADAVRALRSRLDEIAKKTALIPPRIYAYLLSAERLFEFLSEGQRVNPDEAMAELNLAALALFEAQQECQCAGSSTGMAEAMKRLAEMAKVQAELNAQTQSLLQMLQQGGITPDLAGQRLLALAAEQEALRRQLEALEKAIQNNPEATGLERALEGAKEEMKEVEDLMRQKSLDEELLKKQQNIYTRLLEAQESIRKQDYNPKRESETARPYTPVPPPPIAKEEIRKSLLEAARQEEFWRYPPEMQKLIKAYYRTLLEY